MERIATLNDDEKETGAMSRYRKSLNFPLKTVPVLELQIGNKPPSNKPQIVMKTLKTNNAQI